MTYFQPFLFLLNDSIHKPKNKCNRLIGFNCNKYLLRVTKAETMGRKKKEPTEVIRIPTSKKPMVKSILTMGIEGWCNYMNDIGRCFLCGLKYNKCECGTKPCCDAKRSKKQ